MEQMHLISNAHLDPAWLWRWDEGLAEALSTFRIAADFLDEYEGYVFNHNEALLYMWVQEHDPALFGRVKAHVESGRWVIVGGWYLQPDVVMTSGESLISQIEIGRKYFRENFGITPVTAANFDSFGHSRGLVQILCKMGYDSYVIGRPDFIKGHFMWQGYDGSLIHTYRMIGGYNCKKGEATLKMNIIRKHSDQPIEACFWGIGNHGGGASRVDMAAIGEYVKDCPVQIIHSDATTFMNLTKRDDLPVISESLVPCHVGCLTSMVRIKQGNRRLENKIAVTEKILSYASTSSGMEYPSARMGEAKRALAFCQFHDILPGTGIKRVEEDSLNTLGYGEQIADVLFNKAMLKLCAGQRRAVDGEVPIMVFNPHPYEIEGEFEVSFMIPDMNWDFLTDTIATVYDESGTDLPTQNEKPDCTFNMDWPKKISFKGKLKPSSVSRFDCRLKMIEKSTKSPLDSYCGDICIENDKMKVVIGRDSGLIEHYSVGGRVLIRSGCRLEVYEDDEDAWAMRVDSFSRCLGEFTLMSDEEANAFVGYPDAGLCNVKIIECGDVRVKVQALFKYGRNVAAVVYTIPKDGAYVDVRVTMYSLEVNRMIKMLVTDGTVRGVPMGQTAFGKEALFSDGKEAVYHKWCGIEGDEGSLYVINEGIYGGSFTEDSIRLSLLRTPVYSGHPFYDRPIAPHDRVLDHIDVGERTFNFRIISTDNVEREAQIFNEAPKLLSLFPSGDGEGHSSFILVDNPRVMLSSLRKTDKTYHITLYNSTGCEQSAEVSLPTLGYRECLTLRPFEVRFVDVE